MITNHDWDVALDGWVAAERERLGGPPTPEQVVAFTRGELPDAEAERVRALLVFDPELTPLLEEAAPRRKQWFAREIAIAASLLTAFLSLQLARTIREQQQPFVYASRHALEVPHQRGSVPSRIYELPPDETRYLLELELPDEATDVAYRIEIIDAQRSKIVWHATGVRPPLTISIPRALLGAGTYRIDVHGRRTTESFWIRVRRSR